MGVLYPFTINLFTNFCTQKIDYFYYEEKYGNMQLIKVRGTKLLKKD